MKPNLFNFFNRFDSKKGFFCQVSSTNKSDCLGRSKGRHYPPMNETSVEFLKQFYRKNNVALSKLLSKHKYRIPDWLEKELSDWNMTSFIDTIDPMWLIFWISLMHVGKSVVFLSWKMGTNLLIEFCTSFIETIKTRKYLKYSLSFCID